MIDTKIDEIETKLINNDVIICEMHQDINDLKLSVIELDLKFAKCHELDEQNFLTVLRIISGNHISLTEKMKSFEDRLKAIDDVRLDHQQKIYQYELAAINSYILFQKNMDESIAHISKTYEIGIDVLNEKVDRFIKSVSEINDHIDTRLKILEDKNYLC